MGTSKVVEVMTVSEEALALFALEDKYEFWFRSYHLVQEKEMPNPHPAILAMDTMREIVDTSSSEDDEDDVESVGNDSDDEKDNTDSDDDEEDVLGKGFGRGMRQQRRKKQHAVPKKKRTSLQKISRVGSSKGNANKTPIGREKRREEIDERTVQNLGMRPVFTSGKPQAWPLRAIARYNDWCAFLEIYRKNADKSCEQMQHEINLNKGKEDYLGLVVKNKRGKRSLLEMMGDDEEDVRSRVGSIFDGSCIPGSDLAGVGVVYSRYNAKYVTSSVTTIAGV